MVRALPGEIEALLSQPLDRFRTACSELAPGDGQADAQVLAELYDEAGRWFRDACRRVRVDDHADELFAEGVLGGHAGQMYDIAERIRSGACGPGELARLRDFLPDQFDVRLESFERKQYANLSHEANKAMNLNTYIGLLGRRFREQTADGAKLLLPTGAGEPGNDVPDVDYVITLDADSILLPEYALRLVDLMERPENGRVAVAQTPYSSIPGPVSPLEQVAGATTDIQYLVHQGFTRHRATFWVGANAVLRKRALQEILVVVREHGLWVRKYIQDRTVIEDTESSLDLAQAGWELLNHPERLSYSATPPDFGALVVQRRRWANGGLILFPKLVAHVARCSHRRRDTAAEALMRAHYLLSTAATNLTVLMLLYFPFSEGLGNLWLPAAAIPYLWLYARDLAIAGHRRRDVVRVCALNLLLVPVNLGGVGKSLQQALSRRKTAFGRTPKVPGRTAAPPLYLLAAYAMMIGCAAVGAVDFTLARYWHGAFTVLNAVLLAYAIVQFVGLRATVQDIRLAFRQSRAGRMVATAEAA